MHDISTLPEALRKAATDLSSLRILFHANGPAYARLQTLVKAATAGKTAGMPEVCFSKALPGPEWETVMQQAAIALVTMAPGGAETVMPSKTYSAMVAGQAILAICPRQSDLADLIQKHDCGWVVEPGDADGLARVLADITRDPHLVLQKQKRAHEAGHRFYDTTGTIALLWRDLIAGLEEKNT
jgi:hypothetical protein